jgi:hypothetical protein
VRIRTIRRVRFWSPVVLLVVTLAVVLWIVGRPIVAGRMYRAEYASLAYQCDNAMHDEAAIRSYPGDVAKRMELLKSAEVQLLVCHRYDKLRKKMLAMGVTENQLALYGLEALEIEAVPVSRMVEPHQMPRF